MEERPSGAKAQRLCTFFDTAKEAAEKLTKFAKYPKSFPQRLKPRTHSMSLSGTDKSVPFQNNGRTSKQRVETLQLKPSVYARFSARINPCPFKTVANIEFFRKL
jgi:hypothetical protein